MDNHAYLQRIGFSGSLPPTAETLRALHLAHMQSVPFENIDIHLGRPIILKPAQLYEKVVAHRRGGFCYELNGLFAWLLEALGFKVDLLSARVAGSNGEFGAEFDHLVLRVLCPADPNLASTPWLADVGFGNGFRLPLPLDRPGEQQTQGTRGYRIDEEDGQFLLWQRGDDKPWEKQYRFTLEPRQLADFEPMCTYHQTSPRSHFTQRRVCTVATENGRVTLAEQKLIITESGARHEQPVGADEFDDVLAERFDMTLD